jgi:ABC-type branched-subunit amino acid transport system substrate-binding protein
MRGRVAAVLAALALVVGACRNEESGGGSGSGGRTGVTGDEIRVGGVVGRTNPVGRPYQDAFVGAKAFFDIINDDGGVFGKDLKLVAERDDQSQASRNIQQLRALVEEDEVFAAIPVVTQIFAGAQYLVDQGVPTFGWNINAEWSTGPNLFGEKGSFICFTCPAIQPAFIARQVGAERAAVFAYGNAAQSLDCAEGTKNGFAKFGPELVFEDTSLTFGFTDLSADIAAIRENDVDFIATCMDVNGNANIAQALRDAGVEGVTVYSPEGYDAAVLADLGDRVEGFYFQAAFRPFEAPEGSDGMEEYLAAMEERGQVPNEHSLVGWINAQLLVEGIEAAGQDFTREKVINAINKMTDFTAGGILPPQDWTLSHGPATEGFACASYVHVENGEFVPVFGEPGKPFVCFEGNNTADLTGVPSIDNPVYL